jgi:hypothetical protein
VDQEFHDPAVVRVPPMGKGPLTDKVPAMGEGMDEYPAKNKVPAMGRLRRLLTTDTYALEYHSHCT